MTKPTTQPAEPDGSSDGAGSEGRARQKTSGGKSAGTQPAGGTLTVRGRERRQALIQAALTVFERDGFINARITDISKELGIAHGSFYTYFPSKEAIFREVALHIQAEMFDGHQEQQPGLTPIQRIERANRRYLESYQRHGVIMGVIEQVSTFNEDLYQIREERARASITRTERSLIRLQAQGLADPDLDPHIAAVAITSMVSRFAYLWFSKTTGPEYKYDFEAAVATITRLWANAIGLRDAPA